jgi:hypothetical protein
MENIINIYDEDQSNLIIDNSDFNPTTTFYFHNLGEKPVTEATPDGEWSSINTNFNKYQNACFLELHVFDENDKFIITLNSGKPLLKLPSTGKFYFDEFHSHDGTYMVGAKHTPYNHETLEIVRNTQVTPVPYNQLYPGNPKTSQKYGIKISEVFEVLKNIPNFTLKKDTKFKFKYVILGDTLLQAAAKIKFANLPPDDDTDGGDIPV